MANNSTIQSTRDYDKFSLLRGNRLVIPGHVARLTTSILQKNMLAQNPIIVNEKFDVIDGQHRLEVARNNDLEIFYIVIPGAMLEEIITLNSNNRVWNSMDYVNSYASQGDKDFLWLKEYVEENGISISQALLFLFSNEGTGPRMALRKGRLELSERQKQMAIERANILWAIRPFMNRSGFIPRAFLLELVKLIDEGYGDKLVKGVKARASSFTPEASRKEAFNQLRLLMGV